MTNHPAGRESLRQCAFAAPPAHTRRNNGGVTPPSTRHLQKLEFRDSPCANPDRKRQTQLSPSLLTVTYDAPNQRFAPYNIACARARRDLLDRTTGKRNLFP